MATDRSPRPRHDPRDKDVSDQLPEEQQEGAAPREGAPRDAGDAEPTSTRGDAPERDRSKSTGNPRAAG